MPSRLGALGRARARQGGAHLAVSVEAIRMPRHVHLEADVRVPLVESRHGELDVLLPDEPVGSLRARDLGACGVVAAARRIRGARTSPRDVDTWWGARSGAMAAQRILGGALAATPRLRRGGAANNQRHVAAPPRLARTIRHASDAATPWTIETDRPRDANVSRAGERPVRDHDELPRARCSRPRARQQVRDLQQAGSSASTHC